MNITIEPEYVTMASGSLGPDNHTFTRDMHAQKSMIQLKKGHRYIGRRIMTTGVTHTTVLCLLFVAVTGIIMLLMFAYVNMEV